MGEASNVSAGLADSRSQAGIRRHLPGTWAMLGIAVLFLAVLSMGCGLVSGDEEVEDTEEAGDAIRAEIQADLDAEKEGDPDPEVAAAAAPPDPAASAPTEAGTEADSAEAPAAVAALLVANEEQARNLAWAYVSQCITFASSELTATQITGDWYVKSNGQATRDYGFWKVDAATGEVVPHDTRSRSWEAAVAAKCSPDSVQAISQRTRIIPDAAGAVASVWSLLVQCIPALLPENFGATFDPAQEKWVVVTNQASGDQFGTWTIDAETDVLEPYTDVSRQWDSAVGQGCSADLVEPLRKPTPVVVEITAAVTNLCSYLVKCAPGLTVADLQATWNPVNGEWIVITSPDSATDYGVWTARQDGSISPGNQEASRRNLLSTAGTC